MVCVHTLNIHTMGDSNAHDSCGSLPLFSFDKNFATHKCGLIILIKCAKRMRALTKNDSINHFSEILAATGIQFPLCLMHRQMSPFRKHNLNRNHIFVVYLFADLFISSAKYCLCLSAVVSQRGWRIDRN